MIDFARLAIALLSTSPALEILHSKGQVSLSLDGWTLRAGLLNPHSGTELVIRMLREGTTIDHVVRGRLDDEAPLTGFSVAVEIWRGVVKALVDDRRCPSCGLVLVPDREARGCPLCA